MRTLIAVLVAFVTALPSRGQGTWRALPQPLCSRRDAHAMALAGDRVLILGGRTRPTGGTTSQVEVLDLATGRFLGAPWMRDARSFFCAVPLRDGRILAAGGYRSGRGSIAAAEALDPRTGEWRRVGAMSTARELYTATCLPDGRVLVTGGFDNDAVESSTELFDPSRNRFQRGPSFHDARFGHTATLLPDGRVFVAGGKNAAGGTLATTEIYDPRRHQWRPGPIMREERFRHTATLLADGRVLLAGGFSAARGACLADAELFDPRAESIVPTRGRIPEGCMDHTATRLRDGRVLIAGGWSSAANSTTAGTACFDPATGEFAPAAPLLVSAHEQSALLLPNGTVLVSGGLHWTGARQETLSGAWLFTP